MALKAVKAASVLVVAGALALGAGLWMSGAFDPPKDASTLFGLSLPTPDGRSESLSQWKGKVLVVNFWATWCEPCREEMPEFVRAQRELGDRGLQFVGIAVDDSQKVAAYLKEAGLNYPALIGGMGAIELSKALGNRLSALPFTIIVDRNGKVAHTQLGVLKRQQLHDIIDKLL